MKNPALGVLLIWGSAALGAALKPKTPSVNPPELKVILVQQMQANEDDESQKPGESR